MPEAINQPESVPARDTEAELAAVVAQRRAEEASKRGPELVRLSSFPALERHCSTPKLTPEQIKQREESAARNALLQQKAHRDGQIASLVGSAGARYASATIDNFSVANPAQREALKLVRGWIGSLLECSETGGLVLYGPVGTGKDHLAFAACRELIQERGKTVGWINGQAWFGEIRDSMDGDDRTEASIIRRLQKPDVLVISDPLPPFGDLTQHQATMLYRAVDARYSQAKPTICTVNVADDDEADRRMGAATWDRLCHGAWKVHCNWASHRKPAQGN